MPASYVPTAEMPLMKGIRAELVKALDENKSLFEVTLLLPEVVKDLEKVSGDVSIDSTLRNFREETPMMHMLSLLQYMHVKLLRSTIAGTLTYDLWQDPDLGANRQYNENCTPGTYAVSFSIKGRQGRFLNLKELRRPAEWIDKYAESADKWLKNNRAWDAHNSDHKEARDFIEDVDSRVGRADPNGVPRFAPNAIAVEKVRELAGMIRRRRVPALDVANQGMTQQTQAPVVIGCTAEAISKRTKAQNPQWSDVNPLHPAAHTLTSTTKTWALTVSLLYYDGLEPQIVHVAALPFSNPNDLPRTEMLLTTLARSFVWQDGFNVIQGGGRSGKN